MDSNELAQYIEATDSISKPWLLVKLRLKKLEEARTSISADEYSTKLAEIHQDLMNLGQWWIGIEEKEFGTPKFEN